MKNFKLAKYNIKSSIKSITIYYCIMITVITSMTILTKISGGNGYSSGIELSSIIFLFVLGLNFFKENFNFTLANNICREDYFKSVAIAILPIASGMAIFDVTINRVYNLFQMCPTLYDMSYNNFTGAPLNIEVWIQSNSIGTLLGTVSFLFAFYIAAFGVGLLITLIYYKCNKTMKILVSVSPIAIIPIVEIFAFNDPKFSEKILIFINNIFGINTKNSYMAVLTFMCLFIISMGFVYVLVRKAVIKGA